MHKQASKLFKSGLLSLLASLLIMAMFAQGDSPASAQVAAAPITRILQVQPIIISNDDGSETAFAFGGGPGDESYEYIIAKAKEVWAQAGIHVIFLPAKRWNNTLANFGDPCQYDGHTGTGTPEDPCIGGSRPKIDEDLIPEAAEAAGVASVGLHDTVMDAYFMRVLPGWPGPEAGLLVGAGLYRNNTLQVSISDAGWLADQGGWDIVGIETIAHEIGHTLGLFHTEDDPAFAGNPCPPYNVMLGGGCGPEVPRGIELAPSQIAIVLEKGRLVSVPALDVAKTQVNSLQKVVKNMSIDKGVKGTLLLTLDAARLALKYNQPRKACKAMKLFDSSVAYFLSKGKLTDSQGRLLNTASKDIRAAIGCQ